MFIFHSLSFPPNLAEVVARLKTNIAYFQMNYTFIALIILLLSLLWGFDDLFLLSTEVALNVVVSLLIGTTVVAVHGVTRNTDDLFLNEESTGLMICLKQRRKSLQN